MKSERPTSTALDQSPHPWERGLVVVISVLVFAVPWMYGGVEPAPELVALCGTMLVLLLAVGRVATDRWWPGWPVPRDATILIALASVAMVALAIVQMRPLAEPVLRVLSPQVLRTHAELAIAIPPGGLAASYDPAATGHSLRLVAMAVAMLFAVALGVRSRWGIERVLFAVLVLGFAQGVLSLAQVVTRAPTIYWATVRAMGAVANSGSFVNHSNFSQLMNLALGAGLALLLLRLESHGRVSHGYRMDKLEQWGKQHGLLLVALVVVVVGMLMSLSRNGVISLAAASLVVGLLLWNRGTLRARGWWVGAIPFAVFGSLLIAGLDTVYYRMSTLEDRQVFDDRWQLTSDVFTAWRAHPWLGTGLGTHRHVFPYYDNTVCASLAEHADNDLAQLLEEAGLVGGLSLLALVAGVALLVWRLHCGRSPLNIAGYGILLGLIAVLIHSLSDFGQRLPGVFLVTATLLGLLISLADRQTRLASGKVASGNAGGRAAIAAMGLVLLGAGVPLARDAFAAWQADRWGQLSNAYREQLRNFEPGDMTEEEADTRVDELFAGLIASAEAAARLQPNDVERGYDLNLSRWESLARFVDEQGQVVLHPDSIPIVAQIADEVAAVRGGCVTYGPPWILEGVLRWKALSDSSRGGELLRRGAMLSRHDAYAQRELGSWSLEQQGLSAAIPVLERVVRLAPGEFPSVVADVLTHDGGLQFAQRLAGNDHRRLATLASLASQHSQHWNAAAELQAASEAALRAVAASGGAAPHDWAQLAKIEQGAGNLEAAESAWRKAVAGNYQQVEWHLELARQLAKQGRTAEAMAEARIGLRLRPGHAGAKALVAELAVQLP